MTDREIGLCNGIIHTASLAVAGVGGTLAQLPTSDTLAITPIQITMIPPVVASERGRAQTTHVTACVGL